ncbi:FAD/NAD(P)-binding domain-containing protein [Kitasatospora sp. MBT63]|uniref:FAD/NAD(P)-binding protein n=1 Tax=Kitasatospora sp. MBT63 TaxID=1444768 RepID=UPI00053A7A4E|nr:FAD/NAD(P)-binding protein [Kitasatospora sp. MBT63]
MGGRPFSIAVIGAGPRGLSVLERLCARERTARRHPEVTVHLIDPYPPGAGAVWRTDQSRHLLTNTVASQITVYADDSVLIDGPVEPGPSLYEWAAALVRGDGQGQDDQTLAEARDLTPDSYPSRAFYGCYLRAAFERVTARAPGHVRVLVHAARAVAVADALGVPGGPQRVRLQDGSWIDGLDAVVMAQGHLPARPTRQEERIARLARAHALTYLTPANPADVDLTVIAPGEHVLLRGLGLNFFDYVALFTVGRGGTFVRAEPAGAPGDGPGRLVYRPSGQEPVLYACSRRGIPYHGRGENQKGPYGRHLPRLLTPERVAGLRRGGGLRFREHLWPLIAAEVEAVYYGTLLASRGRAAERESFTAEFLAVRPDGAHAGVLDRYRIDPAERWDWDRITAPHRGREFAGREDYRAWLLDHLAEDLRQARAGNVASPLKAALDVLRDLRNEVRLAVDHAGLDGDSHRDDLERWYNPVNAFLSIGPPAARIEMMIALITAGVLEPLGPVDGIEVDTGLGRFTAASAAVPGPAVRATALVEARLPEPDLRRTADPLLLHLLRTGQAVTHRVPSAAGDGHETGGLAIEEGTFRLLDARGSAHPRRVAYGVPTESVRWATAAGIRPGVNSVTLCDSDAVARSVLALPAAAAPLPRTPRTEVAT